jgi:hypothetical protein
VVDRPDWSLAELALVPLAATIVISTLPALWAGEVAIIVEVSRLRLAGTGPK